MARKSQKSRHRVDDGPPGFNEVLSGVVGLLDAARRASARAVNSLMTASYWEIGRRIVEHEQAGNHRAGYGKQLIRRLSISLVARFGRGFGVVQLSLMRQFFLTYPEKTIFQSVNEDSKASRDLTNDGSIVQSLIEKSEANELRNEDSCHEQKSLTSAWSRLGRIAHVFPLPWTHYVRLFRLHNRSARDFYAREALAGGWSARQLNRQIESQFYERSLASTDKATMLIKAGTPQQGDALSADEEIRDPLVLEFLNLKDEFSESDLEEALVRHLEAFLLELGDDFTFVARQRRLRIGHEWFRVDLLFFHRRLRCLVIVDLKLGGLAHADVGQMNLYCNYARENWMKPGEHPPVGLILCTGRDAALAKYAMEGLGNKMLVREYQTTLPRESALAAELVRTREKLERKAVDRRIAGGG